MGNENSKEGAASETSAVAATILSSNRSAAALPARARKLIQNFFALLA